MISNVSVAVEFEIVNARIQFKRIRAARRDGYVRLLAVDVDFDRRQIDRGIGAGNRAAHAYFLKRIIYVRGAGNIIGSGYFLRLILVPIPLFNV